MICCMYTASSLLRRYVLYKLVSQEKFSKFTLFKHLAKNSLANEERLKVLLYLLIWMVLQVNHQTFSMPNVPTICMS